MLLIVSEDSDYSTIEVINWLNYYGVPFYRINDTTVITYKSIKIGVNQIDWTVEAKNDYSEDTKTIEFKDIHVYWYRRGYINLPPVLNFRSTFSSGKLQFAMQEYLNFNTKDLADFLYETLSTKKHIGSYKDNFITKLSVLQAATKAGLDIPKTAVISAKSELIEFKQSQKCIITKGIKNNGFNIGKECAVSSLTSIIDELTIANLPNTFAPSLVQEYIEKIFELRIFYINKKVFTAAIFSQSDETTKVDFRNYNKKKPNRVVPYNLPLQIEDKISNFMNSIGMESGSIDIVVSSLCKYYFLEVNPVGQFGWISKKCNFQIEKTFANNFKNDN